jgi:hypothetical protein
MDKNLFHGFFTFLFAFLLLFTSTGYSQEKDAVKEELFKETTALLKTAKAQNLELLAPENYEKGLQAFQKAVDTYEKGAKINTIRELLSESKQYLQTGFEAAKISKVALEEIILLRKEVNALKLPDAASKELTGAENIFLDITKEAEKGDIRGARSKFDKLKKTYRSAVITGLRKGRLRETEESLKLSKGKMNAAQYKESQKKIDELDGWLKEQEDKPFQISEIVNAAELKIVDILDIILPEYYKNLPDTLLMGDFTLYVLSYETKGKYNFSTKQVYDLSGLAEFSFNCGGLTLIPFPGTGKTFTKDFIVVQKVLYPEREISISEARRVDPKITIGQKVSLDLPAEKMDKTSIIKAKDFAFDNLALSKGDIRVHFEDITFEAITNTKGKIIDGIATYPSNPPKPEPPAALEIDGFTVHIDTMIMTTSNAIIDASLEFPPCIYDAGGCEPAMVDLGSVSITKNCQIYKDMPDSTWGPFIVGNTGITIQGEGLTVDLHNIQSPSGLGLNPGWKGVVLHKGETVSEPSGTLISNTGYLKAPYEFTNSLVTEVGLEADLSLTSDYTFHTLIPYAYTVNLIAGVGDTLKIDTCKVQGGVFKYGSIALPVKAVCSGSPGSQITVIYDKLEVQKDLDLYGEVKVSDRIYWGQLTKSGQEKTYFAASPDMTKDHPAFFYLSGHETDRFIPTASSDFDKIRLHSSIADTLEKYQIGGVTIRHFSDFEIFTEDIPSTSTSIVFRESDGAYFRSCWINVELGGVHAEFHIRPYLQKEELGNTSLTYYKGGVPFEVTFNFDDNEANELLFQFSSSAAFDSDMNGTIHLGGPTNIDLLLSNLETTSTANLVGGDINIEGGVDSLDYWKVELVQEDPTEDAGVLSVKTGQIILLAAGIQEKVHWGEPFWLIWGELLADGNFGELFFNYAKAQRFDGFDFTNHLVSLSPYDPSVNGYLHVCGDNHFDFFGSNFFSINDSVYTGSDPTGAYQGRIIEILNSAVESCAISDMTIDKNWGSGISLMEFDIEYDANDQNGFIGEGRVDMTGSYFGSIMEASIQLDSASTLIGLAAGVRNSFNMDVINMCSASEVWGCICIDEHTLSCITIGFTVESSATSSYRILGGAGAMVEAKVVMPVKCI